MEIARDLKYEEYDALITVSGDGVFHEVINGLFRRPDWREATNKLVLGVIPAGTGNGLAFSLQLNHFSAIRNIIKGYSRPMDLNRVKQKNLDEWSFLYVQWALVSDVDQKSNSMRFLGEARFVVQTLKELVSFKSYHGVLTLKPALTHEHLKYDQQQKCMKIFSLCSNCDQDISLHKDLPLEPKSPKSKDGKKKRKSKSEENGFPDLVDFESVDESWLKLEDKYLLFIAANNNAIAKDMLSNPFAHLNDGYIDLAVSRASNKNLSRGSVLKAFLGGFETGEYVKEPMVEYFKVKGFKLTPDPKSILTIDGEVIPTETITVQNYHNMIKVFSEPEK